MAHSPETSRLSFGRAALLGAVALAVLPVMGIQDAHALPVGACGTPEIMSQHLKAEGHIVISAMNRMVINFDEAKKLVAAGDEPEIKHIAQIVTATRDQSKWHLVTADKPLGEQAGRMCVTLAGHTLEINDHRIGGEPFVSTPTYDRNAALARCKELKAEFGEALACNVRSASLQYFDKELNHRLALQGSTIGRDGQEDGGLVTFVAEPGDDQEYAMLLTTEDGATVVTANGEGFSTSEPILAAVNARRPQASLSAQGPQLAQK